MVFLKQGKQVSTRHGKGLLLLFLRSSNGGWRWTVVLVSRQSALVWWRNGVESVQTFLSKDIVGMLERLSFFRSEMVLGPFKLVAPAARNSKRYYQE